MTSSFKLILVALCAAICGILLSEAYQEGRPFSVLNKRYCRLKKQCRGFTHETEYIYHNWTSIDNYPNIRPEGYLLRLTYYVISEANSNVALSPKAHPDYGSDSAYVIIIGGWNNTETEIRRKFFSDFKAHKPTPGVLSTRAPLKVLIDILTSGEIRVYIEHDDIPVIKWTDPDPLPINYISFASYQGALSQFFFDCPGEQPETPASLKKACKQTAVTGYNYAEFIPISSDQPKGFKLYLPVYVLAAHDAHILLAPEQSSEGDVYEIVIGAYSNERVLIRRQKQGAPLADLAFAEVLPPNDIYTVLIRFSEAGSIEVYAKRAHSQYKLLASAVDPQPLNVKYISFASWDTARAEYFYNCDIAPTPLEEGSHVQPRTTHPLLNDPQLPPGFDKKNVLASRCTLYSQSENFYKKFVPLSEINNSRARGIIARIAVYVQGERDVHIGLTVNDHPKPDDALYEFVIGAGKNSRIVIRRMKGDSVLNELRIAGLISAERPTKIVIEITEDGRIRVYTEGNKYYPVIMADDPFPLVVNYVSFRSNGNKVDYYYNCNFDSKT